MTPTTQLRVSIRYMLRRDLPEVLAIACASFEFPWTSEYLCKVLRAGCCIGLVAECHGFIVGYCVYMLHRNKIEILTFAIHPECRRRGVGRQLMAKLIGKLIPEWRNQISVCVPETNLPAQLFFRAAGLRAEGIIHGEFPDIGEDGYVMVYNINSQKDAMT